MPHFLAPSGDVTGDSDTAAIQAVLDTFAVDDFDGYLRKQMEDPEFRAAYEAAERRDRRAFAGRLAVDGREYQRRLRNRRRRRRR